MAIKYFLLLALLFSFPTIKAQVHRKGVASIDVSKQHPTTGKSPNYTLAQLKGKWQEFQRTDYKGNDAPFSDSLLINLLDSNKVETRTNISNSMSMVGAATIEDDNQLTVAADVYTVKKLDAAELILDDNDQYQHHFKRVETFSYETFGKAGAKQKTTVAVDVTISVIIGNWSVYKRDAKPGAINNNMELIKYLNIIAKTTDSTASGNVTFFKGETSQQKTCTITVSGNNIIIATDLQRWQLPIVEADVDNFVFGNKALLYSCKKTD